jgi:SOS response regulatory protein OraA/RecX
VASALAAKGVDRRTIERVLADTPAADPERAADLARARAARLGGLPPEKAYQRLVAFLVRRGHDPETARRVARATLAIDTPEA